MTGPDRTPPQYVTVAQAADLTGAQPRTIRRWISRGHLAVRSGPFGRLVELGAVERLVAERLLSNQAGEPILFKKAMAARSLSEQVLQNVAADTLSGPDRIGPDQDHGQDRTAIRNGPDNSSAPIGALESADLVALVDRLSRENVELAGRCGFLQAKVQDLEREVRLLTAPSAQPCADGNQPDDSAPAPTPNHPAPSANGHDSSAERPTGRPWWRLWRWLET